MTSRAWVGVVAAAATLVAVGAQNCPNGCSRRGLCRTDGTMKCACFEGFTGADCSLRTCPTGTAWVGYGTTTDGIHSQSAECSNAGACNRVTGVCSCFPGFAGAACDKMSCPGTTPCNGNGLCMTMRQAALGYDGFRLVNQAVSYAQWDADKVYGCVCDLGWSGHDCSQRVCPKGDDPLTTGQLPEVQTLSCTCSGICTGALAVSYGGRVRRLLPSAVATADLEVGASGTGAGPGESLQSVLEGLRDRTTTFASIIYSNPGGPLCTATGNIATLTFSKAMGNAPPLVVSRGSLASSVNVVAAVVNTVRNGTTENAPCSNRGACDATTGACACVSGFASSDGNGGFGSIEDCGYAANATTACPYGGSPLAACSGRGICSGGPNYTCTCFSGYTGAACERAVCPKGRAWFDEATAANTAHALVECSGRGRCDTTSGNCVCASGFTGEACDRTVCPSSDPATPCNSRGRCISLRQMTEEGRAGGVPRGVLEVQALTCNMTGGNFSLSYFYAATPSIAYNADAAALQTALQAVSTVGLVEVSLQSGATAVCATSPGVTTLITFTSSLGAQPLLMATAQPATAGQGVVVGRVTAGTRVTYGADASSTGTWDAEALYGCHCDGYPDFNKTSLANGDVGLWAGADCSLRTCPWGTDPEAANCGVTLAPENQTITCVAASTASGSFTLSFRGAVTAPIYASDTAATLATKLGDLVSVGVVSVTTTGTGVGGPICTAGGSGAVSTVTFLTELGDLPLMAVASNTLSGGGSVTVGVLADGTGTPEECSGRGICDTSTALCTCFTNYGSSNGFGSRGRRGDCGAVQLSYLIDPR